MAASWDKYALEENEQHLPTPAKRGRFEGNERKVESFLKWCTEGHLLLSPKAVLTSEGSCAQYGMLATSDISQGECIFEIPRSMLLTEENSNMAQVLKKECRQLESASGWVPLLLTLMHEYTTPTSLWRPYMDLLDFNQLDLPMFWPKNEVEKELHNTGVVEAVNRDEESLSHEFTSIVLPFVQRYPQYFSKECHELEMYKKMVAFVMAYSFTEPEKEDDDDGDDSPKSLPKMVPMADILNHIAKNNAHLDFGVKSLKMVATKDIKKGREIFNTYGQLSNMHLLHMYGFAEPYPNNHYDTVDILHSHIGQCLQSTPKGITQFDQKWHHLQKIGVVGEGSVCVIGADGILTEVEMWLMLTVLHMDAAAFSQHRRDSDGWESDEKEDEESLLYEDFPKLPQVWKKTLFVLAHDAISRYPNSVDEEEAVLQASTWSHLSQRQQYCVHVRHGQLKLLHRLLDNCTRAS